MRPLPASVVSQSRAGRKLAVVIALLAVLIVGLAAEPALAALRPGLKLSKAIGSVERAYPDPFIGTQSNNQGGGVVVTTVYPSAADCAQDFRRTCDTIDFDLDAPSTADPNNPYSVKYTLTWKGGTANDLDLVIYQCTNVSARTGCTRLRYAGGGNQGVEVIGITDLLRGQYELVVVNMAGLNEGYVLKAEWLDGKYVEFNKPRAKSSPTPPGAASASTSRRPDLALPDTTAEEKAQLEPAKSPGPDGPLTTEEIAALRRKPDDGGGSSPWVWLGAGLVIVAAGSSTAFILRRRWKAVTEGETRL